MKFSKVARKGTTWCSKEYLQNAYTVTLRSNETRNK